MLKTLPLTIAIAAATTLNAAALGDLTTNGDFETGDTSSWQSFPSATSTFMVTSDANSGSFAAEIVNVDPASAAVVKQANLGVGSVKPGDEIHISFAAKGSFAVGGVAFAEFFSEVAGGGVSSAELLTGGPLFSLNDEWQTYCFTTTAGPDVSGGITLQLAAITGGATGSTSMISIDDVSVSIAELGTNGDFELGDTTGWQSFPSATSTFMATADANTGSFGGELFNDAPASGAVIKQANLGVGDINPGDTLEVSFAAKGNFAVGGILFAEFFSEIAGGGTSANEFLGGGPLFPTAAWQDYTFTVTAGPDVSGGVTLQFAAVTGAATGSLSSVVLDDVTITKVSGSVMNFCAVTPNSAGPGAVMSYSGSPSISADDLVLEVSGLPAGTFGLFFLGTDTTSMPMFEGTMCVASTTRIGPILSATGAGTASRAMPSSVYGQFGAAAPVVGSNYFFQFVYRDSIGSGGNWSDGLCVQFGQ